MNHQEAQEQIAHLLREKLEQLRTKRNGYSERAFARYLGVASPVLNQILLNRRPITLRFATQVLPAICTDSHAIQHLLNSLPKKQTRRKGGEPPESLLPVGTLPSPVELSSLEFHAVSDWWYFAVLSLVTLKDARPQPAWIAKKLGITLHEAKRALSTLEKLGLVQKDGKQVRSTGKTFTTTNNVSDLSIRKNHQQGLELAQVSLQTCPREFRDFSSITFAMNPEDLHFARDRIDQLQRELSERLEARSPSAVYRMQVQLFPLTPVSKTRAKAKNENKENEYDSK